MSSTEPSSNARGNSPRSTPLEPRQLAILQATVMENPYIPDQAKDGLRRNLKQIDLLVAEDREILFGGAAGGGKSYGALMFAAQYVTEPTYAALIIRRTFAQLDESDSIYGLAQEWWAGDPRVKHDSTKHRFTFPSGAVIKFGHMENAKDRFKYQGGAYRTVIYDELTQFPIAPMYTYLFSRQRRKAGSRIPLRTLATANPGGEGHEWVKKRFIDPKTKRDKARFIPSRLTDNGNIDQKSYIESLDEVDPLTRAQLLSGDWNAIEGGRFKAEWFKYYQRGIVEPWLLIDGKDFDPRKGMRFITIDSAASTKASADRTAIGVWTLTNDAKLICLAVDVGRWEIPEIIARIKAIVRRWKPGFVAIEEVGAHSGRAIGQLLRRSTDPAMSVRSLNPGGQDKLIRATPAITLAHDGRLYFPESDPLFPLEDVMTELQTFTGINDAHDDVVDMIAYAAGLLPHISSASSPGGTGGVEQMQPAKIPGQGTHRALNPQPKKITMGVGNIPMFGLGKRA